MDTISMQVFNRDLFIKAKAYCLVVFVLCLTQANSQEVVADSTTLFYGKKNAVHFTIGTAIVAYTANMSYERTLYKYTNNVKHFNVYIRVSTGALIAWDTADLYELLQGGILVGKRNNYFETSFGLGLMWDVSDIDDLFGDFRAIPNISAGYRYQPLGKKFLLRTGIGMPELIYFGCGFRM